MASIANNLFNDNIRDFLRLENSSNGEVSVDPDAMGIEDSLFSRRLTSDFPGINISNAGVADDLWKLFLPSPKSEFEGFPFEKFGSSEHIHIACEEDDDSGVYETPPTKEPDQHLRTETSEVAASSGTKTDEAEEIKPLKEHMLEMRSDTAPMAMQRLVEDVTRMVVDFSRLVLHFDNLKDVRTDEELAKWETEQMEIQRVHLLDIEDAEALGDWRLETRLEVHIDRTGEPRASGFMKLRVLSRRGEPFLVVVDWLFRATWAAGRVGSALLRRVQDRWPQCRVVLCTVKPRRPAKYAQQPKAHDAVVAFYRRAGFREAARGSAVLAWLRDAVAGEREHGSAWADLQGLVRGSLGDSLPVRGEDARGARPITWWEHVGGPDAEAARGAVWARATAGTGRGWLAPGAVVEALYEGGWWFAEVARVRARGGVQVGYYDGDGDVTEVGGGLPLRSCPSPALGRHWRHNQLHQFCRLRCAQRAMRGRK